MIVYKYLLFLIFDISMYLEKSLRNLYRRGMISFKTSQKCHELSIYWARTCILKMP